MATASPSTVYRLATGAHDLGTVCSVEAASLDAEVQGCSERPLPTNEEWGVLVSPDQTFGGLVVDSTVPRLPDTLFAAVGDRFVRYCTRYKTAAPTTGLQRSGGLTSAGLAQTVLVPAGMRLTAVQRDVDSGLVLGQLLPTPVGFEGQDELSTRVRVAESSSMPGWEEDGIVELTLGALKGPFPRSTDWDDHLRTLVLALRHAEQGPCVSVALLASAVAVNLQHSTTHAMAPFFGALSCLEKRVVLDVLVALQHARRTPAEVFVRAGDARRSAGTRLTNVLFACLFTATSASLDAAKSSLLRHGALYVETVATNSGTVLVFETTSPDSESCHPSEYGPDWDAYATDGHMYDMGDSTLLVVPIWTAGTSVTGALPSALHLIETGDGGAGGVVDAPRQPSLDGGGSGGDLPVVSVSASSPGVELETAGTAVSSPALARTCVFQLQSQQRTGTCKNATRDSSGLCWRHRYRGGMVPPVAESSEPPM